MSHWNLEPTRFISCLASDTTHRHTSVLKQSFSHTLDFHREIAHTFRFVFFLGVFSYSVSCSLFSARQFFLHLFLFFFRSVATMDILHTKRKTNKTNDANEKNKCQNFYWNNRKLITTDGTIRTCWRSRKKKIWSNRSCFGETIKLTVEICQCETDRDSKTEIQKYKRNWKKTRTAVVVVVCTMRDNREKKKKHTIQRKVKYNEKNWK